MRKILFAVLFFFSLICYSQTSNYWLQSAGSSTVDENLAIAKDNAGNIITAGYFTNKIVFANNTSLQSASNGVSDILIQKTDPSGTLIWAYKAGGIGSDRATAVACDGTGNIYITGHYYGTASFGSFTLNSVNNTQDIFIAKLNPAGTFLWAISAGGNLGEDAYAIHVDKLDNVIVTGEFQGAATFGTKTITSKLNKTTSSFDVFTAKYDASGSFLWVQQGASKKDDRGLDVATDANGNIFVCGQFSDSATFGIVHNNPITNAIFIIKYSPTGQEQWFVRAGSTSSIAYALAVDKNNDIYLTGDYTGNLIFYGTPNNILSGSFVNRVFLVKYDNNGTYLWGTEDASNSYVSSRDVALNTNDEPCIYGEFDCRMDEYSVMAGGTGMFNSIGYHDLFITQYDKNGNRSWARNFGGPKNDRSHGLVFADNLTPYVCGSFEHKLFVNSKHNPFNIITPAAIYTDDKWVSNTNCNNDNGYYYGTRASGASDCFVMHALDNTCPYYDYYYRNGSGCKKDFVKGCIDNGTYNCSDTLAICGSADIYTNTYTGKTGGIGPFYRYQWDTGDTLEYQHVTTSNNYFCVMTTMDGCFTTEDVVYVCVHPAPQPPTISDSLSINIKKFSPTIPIQVCKDSVKLIAGNLKGCSYQWSGSGIISSSDSSVVVNKRDTYTITLTDTNGCTSNNQVYVEIVNKVKPATNQRDTLVICDGNCSSYFIYDSVSNPNADDYKCFSNLVSVITNNPDISGTPFCVNSNLSVEICSAKNGWIFLDIKYMFNGKCGKDSAYFQKPVYVLLTSSPTITATGPICPGDSAFFSIAPLTNIEYHVIQNTSDPLADMLKGGFDVTVYATDVLTGCTSEATVHTKPNPKLSTFPESGLVCPNDSVKITCVYKDSVSWEWHGPSGIIAKNTPSIYESIPGNYYCVAVDGGGCTLTSNTIEIKEYNTPYVIALPDTVVCTGKTLTLQVISNDTTAIQWMAPLSGGGTMKTISESGTYQCSVTMCGITTICSIDVTVANPIAAITIHGSTIICASDSVLLTANAGMKTYLWLPTNESTDSIYAKATGTFVVMETDSYGCEAIDSIHVIYDPIKPTKPTVINDTICAGATANLQASTTGNYLIEWYEQASSDSSIHSGNIYTPVLFQNASYSVSAKDSLGCHSDRTPANVFIVVSSVMPPIIGDTLSCAGDVLNLSTTALPGATYSWKGPNGFTSSISNPQISPLRPASMGTYSLIVNGGDGCISPVATHSLNVINLKKPNITGGNKLCEGSVLTLQGQSSDSSITYHWTGPNTVSSSLQTFTIDPVDTLNKGFYYLKTTYAHCKSAIDSFYVLVKPGPKASIHASSDSCLGSTLNLFSEVRTGASHVWMGPSNFHSNDDTPVLPDFDADKTGNYYFSSTLNGCTQKDTLLVEMHPPITFNLGNDTLVCEESRFVLNPGLLPNYTWNSGSTDPKFAVYTSGQITLTVQDTYGCKYSDSINIEVAKCQLKIPNIFTPNGDGENDTYSFIIDHYQELKFTIFDRWGSKVYENANNENAWDGYNIHSKKPAIDGTYFFIVTAKNIRGENSTDKGFIQLLR